MYVKRLVEERIKTLNDAEEYCNEYISNLQQGIEKEQNRLVEIKNEKEKLEKFLKNNQ